MGTFIPTSEQEKEVCQDFTWYKIVSDRENSMYQVPESKAHPDKKEKW